MIISHKHKFIFIKTRKTGGTSTEMALARLCGPNDVVTQLGEYRLSNSEARNYRYPESQWSLRARFRKWTGRDIRNRGTGYYQHMPASEIRKSLQPDIWNGYFKFTIERNPWDRQVSLYHWHYRDRLNPPSFRTFIKSPFHRKKSRNWKIYTIANRPVVDEVIRYENLEAGLNDILERIGIADKAILPDAKSGYRDKPDYQSYYDDETRLIVDRWYAPEIAQFGYQF